MPGSLFSSIVGIQNKKVNMYQKIVQENIIKITAFGVNLAGFWPNFFHVFMSLTLLIACCSIVAHF